MNWKQKEKTMTVTMVGTFDQTGSDNGAYALDSAAVMITEGLAREMISGVENFDYTWVISADPGKKDSVTAALESAAANAPSGMDFIPMPRDWTSGPSSRT